MGLCGRVCVVEPPTVVRTLMFVSALRRHLKAVSSDQKGDFFVAETSARTSLSVVAYQSLLATSHTRVWLCLWEMHGWEVCVSLLPEYILQPTHTRTHESTCRGKVRGPGSHERDTLPVPRGLSLVGLKPRAQVRATPPAKPQEHKYHLWDRTRGVGRPLLS